jgi:hypothetical protein
MTAVIQARWCCRWCRSEVWKSHGDSWLHQRGIEDVVRIQILVTRELAALRSMKDVATAVGCQWILLRCRITHCGRRKHSDTTIAAQSFLKSSYVLYALFALLAEIP